MDDSSEHHFREWTTVFAALILGACLIVATIVVSNMVSYVKTFNTSQLAVTGSAQMDITSDEVKWTGQYSVNTTLTMMKSGYAQMSENKAAVLAFLQQNGVTAADVTVSPISADLTYPNAKYDPQAVKALGPAALSDYTLTQTVVVQSSDVNKITQLAQSVGTLIDQGVNFRTQSMGYYYTKLPDVRSEIMAKAVTDAQSRAQKIASATGVKLGPLVSVNTGVLQLTPVNSTEISGTGTYDTSTIRKQLTAVVRASFKLSN